MLNLIQDKTEQRHSYIFITIYYSICTIKNRHIEILKSTQHNRSYLVPGSATRTSSWSRLIADCVFPFQSRFVARSLLGRPGSTHSKTALNKISTQNKRQTFLILFYLYDKFRIQWLLHSALIPGWSIETGKDSLRFIILLASGASLVCYINSLHRVKHKKLKASLDKQLSVCDHSNSFAVTRYGCNCWRTQV